MSRQGRRWWPSRSQDSIVEIDIDVEKVAHLKIQSLKDGGLLTSSSTVKKELRVVGDRYEERGSPVGVGWASRYIAGAFGLHFVQA